MPLLMIVEDNELTGAVLQGLLEADGYRVEWAATAEAAKIKTRVVRPRLVVLDYYLPDEDGLTLLRELRADGLPAGTPAVLLTAAADDELAEIEARAREVGGVVRVVRKPFDVGELKRLIAETAPGPTAEGG